MEPTTLYNIFKNKIDKDFISWDPETRKELFSKKTKFNLTDSHQNSLEAMVLLYVNDLAWTDYQTFEKVVWALNGRVPNMAYMEIPPSAYIAYTIYLMNEFPGREFSESVKKYIAAVLDHEEGLCYAPEPLKFIQPYLDKLIENKDIIAKTKDAWENLKNMDIDNFKLDIENPISLQLSKLFLIYEYLKDKKEAIKKELVYVNKQ